MEQIEKIQPSFFGRLFNVEDKVRSPFWVLVQKEIADHLRSWRFIILVMIIVLTGIGSIYTALTSMGNVKKMLPEMIFSFFLNYLQFQMLQCLHSLYLWDF